MLRTSEMSWMSYNMRTEPSAKQPRDLCVVHEFRSKNCYICVHLICSVHSGFRYYNSAVTVVGLICLDAIANKFDFEF